MFSQLSLIRPFFLVFGTYCALLTSGCKHEMTDKERLELIHGKMREVVPLGGTVKIKGNPEPGVIVTLYKAAGSSAMISPAKVAPAITDDEGKFGFTTYIAADGVDPGDYKLTFRWHEIVKDKKLGNQLKGADKLKTAYSDPKASKFAVKVEVDNPQTDLEFDLK